MNKFLPIVFLISVFSLMSCGGDDEATIPAEVGEWELDGFIFADVPSTHAFYDGLVLSLGEIFGADAQSLVMDLANDKSFSYVIERSGTLDTDLDGTWEIDAGEDEDDFDFLILTVEDAPAGANTLEFEIVEIDDDRLVLNQQTAFLLIPDIVRDTFPDFNETFFLQSDEVIETFLTQTNLSLQYVMKK